MISNLRYKGRKNRRLCLLLISAMVCNLLYFCFPLPPFVWRSLIILTIIGVIVYNPKTLFTPFERVIVAFVCLNIFYYIFGLLSNPASITPLINTVVGFMSFIAFGILGRNESISKKVFTRAIVILVIAAVPYYFYSEIQLKILLLRNESSDITNNASTTFLFLLPAIFLLRKRLLSLALLGVILYFILLSAKRGNIVASAIPSLLYLLLYYKEGEKNFWKIFVLLIVVVGVSVLISDFVQNNEYLQRRYEETLQGKTSGRDVIYTNILNSYINSDPIGWIFGHGFQGSIEASHVGKLAHSDWLEIMIDYGIIGLTMYVMIFIYFLKQILKIKATRLRYAILSIFIIWGVKSMISMAFTDEQMYLMALTYGFVCQRYKVHRHEKNIISN